MDKNDTNTTRVITGYEVFRFGIPMIGEYDNAGRGRRVTISPAVPGAQYRITAWALDSGTGRSVLYIFSMNTLHYSMFYFDMH